MIAYRRAGPEKGGGEEKVKSQKAKVKSQKYAGGRLRRRFMKRTELFLTFDF